MIKKVLNDITSELKKLKLKESREWFNSENVPDSVIDDSYTIQFINLSNGDLIGAQNRSGFRNRIINLSFPLKIYYARKIKANDMLKLNIDSAERVETIIKAILSIEVGSNEKDSISFVGSSPAKVGNVLVHEIDFNINYRIT
jgi:hypothetical protein